MVGGFTPRCTRPGKNKRIVWDAGKDLTKLYDMDFRAKVTADDGKRTDEIIWEKDVTP